MAFLKESKNKPNTRSRLKYSYLYKSGEWKEYSLEFRSINNKCVTCGKDVHPDIYRQTKDRRDIGVVDHKTPITMGKNRSEVERLFRDTRNHQTLCTKCHNRKRGKEKLS